MSSSAPPPPSVPYGPDGSTPGADTPVSSGITAEGVAKGVGSTAVKWGIRLAIGILIQAVFRALAGR